MFTKILFLLVFTTSTIFSNSLGLEADGANWNVTYTSDLEIVGFQFNVDGATINSASGGDATANGFTISTNSTTILGF